MVNKYGDEVISVGDVGMGGGRDETHTDGEAYN